MAEEKVYVNGVESDILPEEIDEVVWTLDPPVLIECGNYLVYRTPDNITSTNVETEKQKILDSINSTY